MMILKRRLLTLIFACLCYKKSFLIKNKGISYKIDSCIIQTVKDHGKMLSFDHFFDHNTGEVSRSEISVDRPRELRVCEQTEVFLLFSPAWRLLTLHSAWSILNFDWVNLVFALVSLIFRDHEAGLLHAYQGGTQQMFIRGGSAQRSSPLPLYITT